MFYTYLIFSKKIFFTDKNKLNKSRTHFKIGMRLDILMEYLWQNKKVWQ